MNVQSNMHALIIGATGATGKDLLALLLADPQVDRVDIFVRRAPAIMPIQSSPSVMYTLVPPTRGAPSEPIVAIT